MKTAALLSAAAGGHNGDRGSGGEVSGAFLPGRGMANGGRGAKGRKNENSTCRTSAVFWWGMVDSNHRRHCQQIYSLSPLATREIPQIYGYSIGAGGRIRTPDLLITNQLLYRLSYTST